MLDRLALKLSKCHEEVNIPEWMTEAKTQNGNERKRKDKQILGPYQGTKNFLEYEGDADTNCRFCFWDGPQRFMKGDLKNWKS